jgi:hypothetical protein
MHDLLIWEKGEVCVPFKRLQKKDTQRSVTVELL